MLLSTTQKSVILNQLKLRHTKHWNPKWKKFRKEKVIKVKLPNFNENDDEEFTQEKMRTKFKEQGLMPSKPWIEKQIFLGCTGAVFEPYVPPEGDGKFSVVTTTVRIFFMGFYVKIITFIITSIRKRGFFF